MTTAGLQIRIGADVAAGISGIKSTTAALNTLPAAAASATAALRSIEPGLRNVSDATTKLGRTLNDPAGAVKKLKELPPVLNNVPPAAGKTAAALNSLNPAAKQSSAALLGVSRILQDLPYGFQGVANNIEQLPALFGSLALAAKESGQSIGKTLLQSLTGAGGIGLALSAVTAGLTFASVGFTAWERLLGNTDKKQKEAADSAREFAESLRDAGTIADEATAGVAGDIARVNALATAVTDTNKTYAERKRALEELKQTNKGYFGDLTLEEAKLGTITARVQEYTKALAQQAVIKAFEGEIGKVAVELNKQEKAFKGARDAKARADAELAKVADFKPSTALGDAAARADALNAEKVRRAQGAQADANKTFNEQRTILEQLRVNYTELNGAIESAVSQSLKFKDVSGGGGAVEDPLKKRIEALKSLQSEIGLLKDQQLELVRLEVQLARRDGIKLGFTPAEIEDQVQGIIDREFGPNKEFVNSRFKISVGGEVDFSATKVQLPDTAKLSQEISTAMALPANTIDIDVEGIARKLKPRVTALQAIFLEEAKRMAQLTEQFASIVQTAAVDAFTVAGESIGAAISGNFNLDNVLDSFLDVMGGALINLGKQLIIFSKTIAAIRKAAEVAFKANPILGVVAGIAAIAVGTALKSAFDKTAAPKFREGGMAVGPQSGYLAELHGNELIIPMNKIDRKVPGSAGNLLGSANAQPIFLQPSVAIKGTDIEIMLGRVQRSNARLYGT
jgi:hypothetical protein